MKIINTNDKNLFTLVTFVSNKATHFISKNVCKKNKNKIIQNEK